MILSFAGFKLFVWLNLFGDEKLPYHYEIPFFFMVKFGKWITFSLGAVKRMQHKKCKKNEWIIQVLHSKVFQLSIPTKV